MQLVAHSTEDTQNIAAELAKKVLAAMTGHAAATIIALRGELGAGKTTFTQGFAKALGITRQPKSPTFLLAKQYAIPRTPYSLWHLDCYRLKSHQDLVALDLHTLFDDPSAIILIEWPERIGSGLPREHIEVHMEHVNEHSRTITISKP